MDITITLDHIPEGCDYEMVLYDEEGNQVGIGKREWKWRSKYYHTELFLK